MPPFSAASVTEPQDTHAFLGLPLLFSLLSSSRSAQSSGYNLDLVIFPCNVLLFLLNITLSGSPDASIAIRTFCPGHSSWMGVSYTPSSFFSCFLPSPCSPILHCDQLLRHPTLTITIPLKPFFHLLHTPFLQLPVRRQHLGSLMLLQECVALKVFRAAKFPV